MNRFTQSWAGEDAQSGCTVHHLMQGNEDGLLTFWQEVKKKKHENHPENCFFLQKHHNHKKWHSVRNVWIECLWWNRVFDIDRTDSQLRQHHLDKPHVEQPAGTLQPPVITMSIYMFTAEDDYIILYFDHIWILSSVPPNIYSHTNQILVISSSFLHNINSTEIQAEKWNKSLKPNHWAELILHGCLPPQTKSPAVSSPYSVLFPGCTLETGEKQKQPWCNNRCWALHFTNSAYMCIVLYWTSIRLKLLRMWDWSWWW